MARGAGRARASRRPSKEGETNCEALRNRGGAKLAKKLHHEKEIKVFRSASPNGREAPKVLPPNAWPVHVPSSDARPIGESWPRSVREMSDGS